ncbi:hypothetical protein D3C78_1548860 [compost metagenome]|nr:protein of unknown function [Pseudomonas sp. JV241A]
MWCQVSHELNSVDTIVCFAHHTHTVLFQQYPDGQTNDWMIVNYQNAVHSVISTLKSVCYGVV